MAEAFTSCHFGGWLPKDSAAVDRFLSRIILQVYKTEDMKEMANIEKEYDDIFPLHPSLQELKMLIETNPEIYESFTLMFTEVPQENQQIPNYDVFLRLLNFTLTMSPPFYSSELVGIPLAAMFLQLMLTPAGNVAFKNDKVNAAFKKVLNAWCKYLKSSDSQDVLNEESGWLSEEAMTLMPGFKETYVCDHDLPHWGFKSWDDFFARRIKKEARPVATGDNIIINACEASPLVVRRNVQLREPFWIKKQPYCLGFMLAGDPLTDRFVGGTVYQGFLSQFSYHHWHSPVDGTIVKAYNVDGSYFAVCLPEGFHSVLLAYSQCYVSSMAARCLIFIQADNPHIGMVVFVGIGLTEVSSCEIVAKVGDKVKKGDELGMFHYGGSSHCLVFERGVDVRFVKEPPEPDMTNKVMRVNSKLGEVF